MNTPSIRILTCASLLGAALALGGCEWMGCSW